MRYKVEDIEPVFYGGTVKFEMKNDYWNPAAGTAYGNMIDSGVGTNSSGDPIMWVLFEKASGETTVLTKNANTSAQGPKRVTMKDPVKNFSIRNGKMSCIIKSTGREQVTSFSNS